MKNIFSICILTILLASCGTSTNHTKAREIFSKVKKENIKQESNTINAKNSIDITKQKNKKIDMDNLPEGIYVKIKTKDGTITGMLEYERAPLTVANFVALTEGTMPNTAKPAGVPFYDSLNFHRVISVANGDQSDFMIQGGDPLGSGAGNPGYRFRDEFHPELNHSTGGMFSMANSGPGTNGSQFFITIAPTTWLDGKHAVFGHVIDGKSIVDNMKQGTVMEKVSIIRIGESAKKFDALATFNSLK